LVNGNCVEEYPDETLPEYAMFEKPPSYDSIKYDTFEPTLASIMEETEHTTVADNFALSPHTMRLLEDFLNSHPMPKMTCSQEANLVSILIRKCPHTIDNCQSQFANTIDPSLLEPEFRLPTSTIRLPMTSQPDSTDIDDIAAAVFAALSDEDNFFKVLHDSSEDETEPELSFDMILNHVWSGYDIKYM
jgi:hypothetical protein